MSAPEPTAEPSVAAGPTSSYRPERDRLADAVAGAVSTVAAEGGLDLAVDPASVHLERPARREHGDWSTNIALVTAKKVGTNPRALATSLVEVLERGPPDHVVGVEIAGPGLHQLPARRRLAARGPRRRARPG